MAPEIITAGIAGLTQLAGGAMQSRATKEANDTARKWQLEDRAHDEYYNSPAHQKALLRNAGLAPEDYVGSSQTASNTVVPTPDPIGETVSGLGTSMVGAFNATRASEDSHAMLEANKAKAAAEARIAEEAAKVAATKEAYNLESMRLGISKVKEDINNSQLDATAKKLQNDFLEQTLDFRVAACATDSKVREQELKNLAQRYDIDAEQLSGLKLDNDIKTFELKGKKYEVEKILPEQYNKLVEENKLLHNQYLTSEIDFDVLSNETYGAKARAAAQFKILTGQVSASELQAFKDDKQLQLFMNNVNLYYKMIANEMNCDLKTAAWLSQNVLKQKDYMLRYQKANAEARQNDADYGIFLHMM